MKKHFSVTNILVISSVLCIAVGSIAFFVTEYLNRARHGAVTVELRANGFYPHEITIRQGEQVKFVNAVDRAFWPASDLHPTHELYPEFDPKKPIPPGAADWSFTFTQAGDWSYHDHLHSTYTGVVHVLAPDGSKVQAATCGENAHTPQCWDEQLTRALKTTSLDGAFLVFSTLYTSEPLFAASCHAATHKLGEAAYDVYAAGQAITLTDKTSYCGYGFYHGFIEKLLFTSGDITQARDFCAGVGRELAAASADAEGACYHGIGHGLADGSDPTKWGNAQELVSQGLQTCEQVAVTDVFKNRCASGVFNSLAILYGDPKYKLVVPLSGPYTVCEIYEKEYIQKPCYEEMNTLALRTAGGNFAAAVELVNFIKDHAYAPSAMQSLAGAYAVSLDPARVESEFPAVQTTCLHTAVAVRSDCVKGFAAGLIEHGTPGAGPSNAFHFCQSTGFGFDLQADCLDRITAYLRVIMPQNEFLKVCTANLDQAEISRYCSGSLSIVGLTRLPS